MDNKIICYSYIRNTYKELKPFNCLVGTIPLDDIRNTYKELKHKFSVPFEFEIINIRNTYKELKQINSS